MQAKVAASRLDNGTGYGRTGSGGANLRFVFFFFQINLGPTSHQCPQHLQMVSRGSPSDRLSLELCAWMGSSSLGEEVRSHSWGVHIRRVRSIWSRRSLEEEP